MRHQMRRYTSVVLLALMLPYAGKFAKAQDPPVPPLYWEYRDLMLPDKPDLFTRLTIVPRFYMGDPPTYVDAITVALRKSTKDSSRGAQKDCCDDSKILSQFGPFQSGELLSADVISIHGKTWVLVSTRQSSGLGDIIFFESMARDWQTSLASCRKNADGDLLVTLWPSNRNEGLPRIWRHDGVSEYPAPKEESALLETVAKDAVSDVEFFQDNGATPPLTMVYDCSRILQAEASVGNLVAALRTCGLAREKLLKRSFCDSV